MGRSSTASAKIGSTSLPSNLPTNWMAFSYLFEIGKSEWTGWDLNPWPPACKAGDLPLIYRPLQRHVEGKDRGNSINLNILFDRRDFSV